MTTTAVQHADWVVTMAPQRRILRDGGPGLGGRVGALEDGMRADLALFRIATPDWVPVHNPLGNLAYSSRGGADTVIAEGRVLMHAGIVRCVDESKVLGEVQERAEALLTRANLRHFCQPAWPVE